MRAFPLHLDLSRCKVRTKQLNRPATVLTEPRTHRATKNIDEHVHAAYIALLRTPLATQNLTDDDVEMLAELCGNAGAETFIVANNPVYDHTPPTARTTTRVTLLSPPPRQLSPSR